MALFLQIEYNLRFVPKMISSSNARGRVDFFQGEYEDWVSV